MVLKIRSVPLKIMQKDILIYHPKVISTKNVPKKAKSKSNAFKFCHQQKQTRQLSRRSNKEVIPT